HWDNVASRDREKTYNPMAWEGALALFGVESTSLNEWAASLAAPTGALEEVVLRQPCFTQGLGGLLGPQRLDAWKDWLRYRIILGDAPYLSSDFVAAHFDF